MQTWPNIQKKIGGKFASIYIKNMVGKFELQWRDITTGEWILNGKRAHGSLPKARAARDKIKKYEKKHGIRGYKYRIIQVIE